MADNQRLGLSKENKDKYTKNQKYYYKNIILFGQSQVSGQDRCPDNLGSGATIT
jgi:hypothetical protein